MENIQGLTKQILEVHQYFKQFALKQINNALTLRNWIVGYYIVEYEQEGKGPCRLWCKNAQSAFGQTQ